MAVINRKFCDLSLGQNQEWAQPTIVTAFARCTATVTASLWSRYTVEFGSPDSSWTRLAPQLPKEKLALGINSSQGLIDTGVKG